MPQHPRIHAPGLLSHLMARGNNGQAVFLGTADYAAFLTALQTTRERSPVSLYAYALMPNHFHLLLEVGLAQRGLIDPGPGQGQLATPAQYEAFGRAGVKGGYRAEWHPSDSAPFLGTEKFVRRVGHRRESLSAPRPPSLAALWQQAAMQAGLTPEALRHGGRSARLVQARERFIRRAVLEAGYRAVTVATFIGCHAANISRALQKEGD